MGRGGFLDSSHTVYYCQARTNLQVVATYLLRGDMEHEVHWGSTVYGLGHPSAVMFGPHCVTLSRKAEANSSSKQADRPWSGEVW